MARSKKALTKAGVNAIGKSLRTGLKPSNAFSGPLVPTECSTPGCFITHDVPEGVKLTCEFCSQALLSTR
jgi:hypothetical protein